MEPKPPWLKIKYNPANEKMKLILEKYQLNTVCQGAHCPNCQECWSSGTATFMVLGEECTRNCRFCAVKKMQNWKPGTGNATLPDPSEPNRLAKAVEELKLKYVVLTSVDRDDLPDYGASHFAECIKTLKTQNPKLLVEALVPDFNNDKKAIETIAWSGVDVLGHNIETVERLTPKVRDARAGYKKSLDVLLAFKANKSQDSSLKTKSSLMLGLGETKEEIIQTMRDLMDSNVDILTLGQYLQPTKKQLPIERYVTPEEFKEFEEIGRSLGFKAVFAGPFVRSSYRAAELSFFIYK